MIHLIAEQSGEDTLIHGILEGPEIELTTVFNAWVIEQIGPEPKAGKDTPLFGPEASAWASVYWDYQRKVAKLERREFIVILCETFGFTRVEYKSHCL